ncbi:MAG: acyl-CoA/acyl-ACP dehydrogenase [Candidatus Thiodiazotropha sp.]
MLDGELNAILSQVQEIATEVVAPLSGENDKLARWPETGLRTLQSAGLGGLVVPKEFGGKGYGLFALTRVCEILGHECASTAICYGMHSVGTSVIAANATPQQQERYLEPICAGKHITTLSLSESGTGAHFYLPQTSLEAVNWGAPWDGLGMRGNSSRSMELRGVLLPRANLLGNEGDQIWYTFNVIMPYFLVAMGGTFLGVASAAIEEARKHMLRRYHAHTGANLAQNSVLQHRLATLWSTLERSRRFIYHAAKSFDAGEPDALISVMAAKADVADTVVSLVNEAMTFTGGIGYRNGSKLHRMLRDARACHLMSPTTDILRVWIGRALLGLPLLAD